MISSPVALMGVLNITPDSFSDGGKFASAKEAISHGHNLQKMGADIVDVGGESTGPGAELVGPQKEQQRILDVIRELSAAGVRVSVDTINADTAKKAVLSGAVMINDVSGATFDKDMLQVMGELAKSHGISVILGHWRGIPDADNKRSHYDDVVSEVRNELVKLADAALEHGVPRENIYVDPGLGFDKNVEQSWELLARIDELKDTGYKVCVGASRKRMVAEIVRGVRGEEASFSDGDLTTAVVSVFAARAGADMVRVHDVPATKEALEVQNRVAQIRESAHAKSPIPGEIKLKGLEVYAHHGVFDFEREKGQKFFIDIEILTDMQPAISGDALAETVHYGDLADRVVAAVEKDPVDLIETVADRVANIAMSYGATLAVTVTVHKPDAPIAHPFEDVSVSITKVKEDEI